MRNDLHFGSDRQDWNTPRELYTYLDSVFRFKLDAATSADNPLGAPAFYAPPADALELPWETSTFLNPPYGRQLKRWVEKAAREGCAGNTVVCLLPARTDTKWWLICERFGEITYLTGRVPFTLAGIDMEPASVCVLGPNGKPARLAPAPFPSAIVVFRPRLPGRLSLRALDPVDIIPPVK